MFGLKKLLKPASRLRGKDKETTAPVENDQVEERVIEGDRSIPNIAKRRNAMSRPIWIGATCLTCIALGAVAFFDRDQPDNSAANKAAKSNTTESAPKRAANTLEPLDIPDSMAVNPNIVANTPAPGSTSSSTAPTATYAPGATVAPIAVTANGSRQAQAGHVPAIAGGGAGAAGAGYSNYPRNPNSAGNVPLSPEEKWKKRRLQPGAASDADDTARPVGVGQSVAGFGSSENAAPPLDEYSSKLRPTSAPAVQAEKMIDRNYLLGRGKTVSCTTIDRIDSTQPGSITCTGDADVYSDNGNVLLFEKGTEYIGIQRGGLQQGQARVFILWEEARTPRGVKVMLASPAADALGAAGVDGYVDSHFWQRFGGALMLSIVQDATSRAGSADAAPATANAGRDAASEAVRNSINIPPTLKKNHGQTVTIKVARDIDFRTVYDLVPTT